ncbi:signal peptidase II, partial [Candidatus Gracilibacteria bacterium]|nr:signal peptidase II [Candidatus Gracilibacteria bacterium]
LLLGFAGFDQGSKYLLNNDYLDLPYKITDFFRLTLVHNDGIAFSWKLKKELILILTAVVGVGLLFMFFQKYTSRSKAIGLAMVLGGAVGNFLDRIIWGAVTDFISVFSFPVFNFADAFITVGLAIWLFDEVFGS